MRYKINLTVIVVVVVVTTVCAQATSSAADSSECFHHGVGTREAERERLRRVIRLKSRVQAYNIVDLLCPFSVYRYEIAAVVAGLGFLCTVVYVYSQYYCDYGPVKCTHAEPACDRGSCAPTEENVCGQ